MSAVITPFEGTELFNTASFNNRISQINTGFSYVSNPNLLDNWYFANPVNQRGLTEYTSVGYTVDRWMIGAGSSGTLSLADSGLKLARTDGIMYLAYRILKTQIPEGNVLTYSVLTTSGLFSTSFVIKNDTYHEQIVGGGISLGWNYTPAEMVEFTLVNNTVNSDVTILAAKLELGDTQTLAHQDATGNWVLNEVPDYGEQLAKCQRYYFDSRFKISDNIGDGAYVVNLTSNGQHLIGNFRFPVSMRTVPAVKIYSLLRTENCISYWANAADVSGFTALANTATVGPSGFNSVTISSDIAANYYAFHITASADL